MSGNPLSEVTREEFDAVVIRLNKLERHVDRLRRIAVAAQKRLRGELRG